ncbi:helix-turn-helix domain-containing protein [Flavobacterium sp.]|uniref:helix-turn-helix domain-containing protein n=1 Tax=Flavobacterium sp. TaxID=239 RepID=UPI0025BC09B7|nr:helix-turn-helix domain-containing protein [Flavobacterium sp.]
MIRCKHYIAKFLLLSTVLLYAQNPGRGPVKLSYKELKLSFWNNEGNKKFQKEYNTLYLILEKENLTESTINDKTKLHWSIGVLFLVVIIAIFFRFYQYRIKKRQPSQFEKGIHRSTNNELRTIETNEIEVRSVKSGIENIGINEELVVQILEKLTHFEKTKGYLFSSVTVQSLSSTFETNSKYVSKVVNTYKEKTFVQYINDLRIEYALQSLEEDSKLQKYTIQALAVEFGFNNAESFSTAFYKKTGIKPVYFIKQLEIRKDV